MKFSPAFLAPTIAAGASAWFSCTYAWALGHDEHDKYGLVAFALAIAIGNASFLAIASNQWRDKLRIRALCLLILWALCFGVSLTTGFGYFVSNRMASSADDVGHAEERQRAQDKRQTAMDALTEAKSSEEWKATQACTVQRTTKRKEFCAKVKGLEETQRDAEATLDRIQPVTPNPEIKALATTFGMTFEKMLTLMAMIPALAIELIASFGFFAIRQRMNSKAIPEPQGGQESVSAPQPPKSPQGPSRATAVSPAKGSLAPTKEPSTPYALPRLTWPAKANAT